MLGGSRVAAQPVASRVVLSSIELVGHLRGNVMLSEKRCQLAQSASLSLREHEVLSLGT
jgi:hypothetical protein